MTTAARGGVIQFAHHFTLPVGHALLGDRTALEAQARAALDDQLTREGWRRADGALTAFQIDHSNALADKTEVAIRATVQVVPADA